MTGGALPPNFPGTIIAPQMGAGEKILWSGKPRQGFFFRLFDVAFIPVGLFVAGLSGYGAYDKFSRGDTAILSEFNDVVMALLGLYWLFGRFIVDALQRARTYYAVTDHQIFIVFGLFKRKVTCLSLPDLSEVSLSEAWRGRGTIFFRKPNSEWPVGVPGVPGNETRVVPHFDSIRDARRVYDLICTAQKQP